MAFQGTAQIVLILFCTDASYSSSKVDYVIGGNVPGTPAQLLQRYTPVLSTYLTDTVGRLYDPPLKFSLIPVDYASNATMTTFINAGMLDFVCE